MSMSEIMSADPRFSAIEENLKIIRNNIAEAEIRSGRSNGEVRLMAVTKTVEPKYIDHAISLGIDLIGENKVQEFLLKKDELDLDGVEKHLIGHLQTNKVRKIITEVDMIQSVDSVNVASEISRQAVRNGICADVLIEINIAGEDSKTGMDRALFEENLYEIAAMDGIHVRGLMGIPPICENNDILCGFFDDMFKLFVDIKGKNIDNIDMDILSMGMSGDYVTAVEHGSNLVRIGSSLFGMRNYR